MLLNCSCNRNYFIYRLLISYFCLISAAYSACFPQKFSDSFLEIAPMMCLFDFIASRSKPEELDTKGNELARKPETTDPKVVPVTESKIDPPDHPYHKNRHVEATTSGNKTKNNDERKKRLSSAFTSVEKKERSKLDNRKTQVEDKIFMQICAVEVAFLLILILGSYYYISEMRAIEKSVQEIMRRAQADAHLMVEEVSHSQGYLESYEEMEPISNNDEQALVTLSSMVFCHLQNLAKRIKKSKPGENSEKYLTEDFLQLIATHIVQDSFMKQNFQKLLPAETLLQLGQLHYHQKRRNGSRLISSYIETNGNESQQHSLGKLNNGDVKVSIGVLVGGKEIMLAQTKKEESEEKEENSSA